MTPDGGNPGDTFDLIIIVDGANVVGSRPDGWWRDRAGAAVRLHDELTKLAVRGRQGIPAETLATPESGDGGLSGLISVLVLLVLEGAARKAVPRIEERARACADQATGTVQVVSAPGSGDDEIARQARSRAGQCIVVTADRELRRRCVAAGARVAGPSWLYHLL